MQRVRRDAGTGIAQYVFSANGTLIYVPGEAGATGGSVLAVVDRASVDAFSMPAGAYADPRISPDGSSAAFTATYPDGEDIAVYELGGNTAPRRLTFGGTSRYPLWSDDSTRVAFQSTRDGTASLYWQLADGSDGEPVRLTTAADGETHLPDSFSPDGQWLTFSVAGETDTGIRLLELATGETEPLIAQPGASQSVFSPDGRWLAYQSTETGSAEIFVQPFPLTGAKYQLPHTNTNHHPAWSADGRALYYFPGQTNFDSVSITTEPRFAFGTAEPLGNNPMNAAPATRRLYDVMPDGSGLLGSVPADTAGNRNSNEIRIVQNWFEELEQLVPTH